MDFIFVHITSFANVCTLRTAHAQFSEIVAHFTPSLPPSFDSLHPTELSVSVLSDRKLLVRRVGA